MEIRYTTKGMEILHPSGVVQILSIEDLTRIKDIETNRQTDITKNITELNLHITKTQEASITP